MLHLEARFQLKMSLKCLVNAHFNTMNSSECLTETYPYYTYLLLTEFEVRALSYGPSFFLFKREARGP